MINYFSDRLREWAKFCDSCGADIPQHQPPVQQQYQDQPTQQSQPQQSQWSSQPQGGYYEQPTKGREPKKPFYKTLPFIGLIVVLIVGAVVGSAYFMLFGGETDEEKYRDMFLYEWRVVEEDGRPVEYDWGEYGYWEFKDDGTGIYRYREIDDWEDSGYYEYEMEFDWKIIEAEDYNLIEVIPDEPGPYKWFMEYRFLDDETLELRAMGSPLTLRRT